MGNQNENYPFPVELIVSIYSASNSVFSHYLWSILKRLHLFCKTTVFSKTTVRNKSSFTNTEIMQCFSFQLAVPSIVSFWLEKKAIIFR